MEPAMDLDAPLSLLSGVSPRLADKAAPAAFCWAADLAGMFCISCSASADETLELAERFVVGNLPRRVLAEGRCRGVDGAREAAIAGDLCAADEVDGDA